MQLQNAILETLVYSDIFDYPLTLDELHRYLVMPAAKEDVFRCIEEMDQVGSSAGYYFLAGRDEVVALRRRRARSAQASFRRAVFYGRILGRLPFIRMVALTGSLALLNCDAHGDYDYMLIAKPGRVWTARGFALLVNRAARLFGATLCPNLIVSETALEWKPRNLYAARELSQMVLIHGNDAFHLLRTANRWVEEFLPNLQPHLTPGSFRSSGNVQTLLEFPLRGKLGDLLESWEMNRKIIRLTRQAGYGLETRFNAEICQGNFDHHGSSTLDQYQKRLKAIQHRSLVEA